MNRVKLILLFFLITGVSSAVFNIGHPFNLKGDDSNYNDYATNLVSGKGYSLDGKEFSAFREPGYPIFIAIIYKVAGINNFSAVRVVQIIILGLIGLFIYLSFELYQRKKWGTIAGITVILIPYYGYYTGQLFSELLFSLLLVVSFYLCLRILIRNSSSIWYVLLGLVFGYAVLVRTQLLLFPIVICLFAIFIRSFSIKKIVILLVTFLMVVMSWGSYVYHKTGHFYLTTSYRTGLNFYNRADRAGWSYGQLISYYGYWISRSSSNGDIGDRISNYEDKLKAGYYNEIASGNLPNEIQNRSLKTIFIHFDKYIFGSGIELLKLNYIDHIYAPSVDTRYLRVGFYIVLYLLFLYGIINFFRFKNTSLQTMVVLAGIYLVYNQLLVSAFDAIPRYNTPYLVFFLLVGLAGLSLVWPLNEPIIKKQK